MARWQLSVEAANFDATVFDTDDLSTIRGASWAMLKFPQVFAAAFQLATNGDFAVEEVFAGASRGDYLVSSDKSGEAALRDALGAFFSSKGRMTECIEHLERRTGGDPKATLSGLGMACAHLTFKYALVADGDADADAKREKALAVSQFRTIGIDLPEAMTFEERETALTVRAPGLDERSRRVEWPCILDKVRPVAEYTWKSTPTGPVRDVPVSASVAARRHFGRGGRRHLFYREFANVSEELGFADSFEEIAFESPPEPVPEAMRGRMCVLFMDGNAFGEIRNAFLASGSGATGQGFARALTAKRAELLKAAVQTCSADPNLRLDDPDKRVTDSAGSSTGWAKRPSPVLRMETLLWGGDESVLAFPAWGLEQMLTAFDAVLKGPDGQMDLPGGGSLPLTYSIGIVVCNYKTPIRLAKALAEDLSYNAKTKAKAPLKRDPQASLRSFVDLMVLDGIETPATSLEAVRREYYGVPREHQPEFFAWPLASAAETFAAFRKVKGEAGDRDNGLPRQKLAELVSEARKDEGDGALGSLRWPPDAKSPEPLAKLISEGEYYWLEPATEEKHRFEADFFARSFRHMSEFAWAPLVHLLSLWRVIGPGADQ